MRKHSPMFLLTTLFLITGCGVRSQPNVGNPNVTIDPTSTRLPSTVLETSIPVIELTPLKSEGFQGQCQLMKQEASAKGFLSNGYIVLDNNQYGGDLYAFNNQNDSMFRVFRTPHHSYPVISPNGQWIAYVATIDNDTESLAVQSLDGRDYWSVEFSSQQLPLIYWLDNEKLMIGGDSNQFLVVYPFGKRTERLIVQSDQLAIVLGTIPIYDTAVERMVYQRKAPVGIPAIVLWDAQEKKQLWRLEVADELLLLHGQAEWAPDGSKFVVGAPQEIGSLILELFIVGRNGKVIQIIPTVETNMQNATIDNPTWSPNGRNIAFWLNGSLSVLDTETDTIKYYCLESLNPVGLRPIWSPSGQQIIVNNIENVQSPSRVIAVDIEENKVIEIAKDYIAIGWMVEKPMNSLP
jgi:hypothetical protein